MRILPVMNTYPSADLHITTHTLTHVPTCSSLKVGSCRSIDTDIKTFLLWFFLRQSVKDSDVSKFHYVIEISPECRLTGKEICRDQE